MRSELIFVVLIFMTVRLPTRGAVPTIIVIVIVCLHAWRLACVRTYVRTCTCTPLDLQRAMDLAQEKGASSWLTSLPLEEFGFTLHKGAFKDTTALRYGWLPSLIPSTCACGSNFSVEHVLLCPKGGFPIIQHNEVRDFTANLMTEVCHDVCVEPNLQPITGEVLSHATAISDDGARLDIAANGFWGGRFERAFFDVRVFNLHAPSNRQPATESMKI